jgi:hypothetical protein
MARLGATLAVTEVGAPNNGIFNSGVGAFEIPWIALDGWVEGSGRPTAPATEGVAYQDLGSVLNPAVDVSLGQFTNSGADGSVSFSLALAGALVSNVVAGTDLNLYLTAASTSVGFTFNSRDFTGTNSWPSLTITAAAKPLARITSIGRLGTNQVAIRFNTVSNWAYAVQGLTIRLFMWTRRRIGRGSGEIAICLTQSTNADTNPGNRIHSIREAGVPARLGQEGRTREPPTAADATLLIIPKSQHAPRVNDS